MHDLVEKGESAEDQDEGEIGSLLDDAEAIEELEEKGAEPQDLAEVEETKGVEKEPSESELDFDVSEISLDEEIETLEEEEGFRELRRVMGIEEPVEATVRGSIARWELALGSVERAGRELSRLRLKYPDSQTTLTLERDIEERKKQDKATSYLFLYSPGISTLRSSSFQTRVHRTDSIRGGGRCG